MQRTIRVAAESSANLKVDPSQPRQPKTPSFQFYPMKYSIFILAKAVLLLLPVFTRGQECTSDLAFQCSGCSPCCSDSAFSGGGVVPSTKYNCSLPGLELITPGKYEGTSVNYLSFATETSSPNLPIRAKEFQECTGGTIVFSEAANVWEDPIQDLGTKTSRGSELYDGYLMSYSHFPEASALDLAEHLNERIRNDNARLKWEDVLPKVRAMGEYRKDGATNIDFLMYDGDFFVPIIRLDLLEKHNKSLPNTWDEVAELAKFFNGTDLNDDGDPNDFGFCHFPRRGAGYWDWWWPEALYSTWASFEQTEGLNQGFFFDEETFEAHTKSGGFQRAAEIWKDLWQNGADGCITDNFITGRCAIGFSPPGCWKGVFLSPDGVARHDENGTVIWRPTMKSGEYAEPYRFKPFGSTTIFDQKTGEMKTCDKKICPKAEVIPARGHFSDDDRANILPESPLKGQLANRAPFYWSGGLGTLIRRSTTEQKKDFMWDFFVYSNAPETSVYDVANYASWLDSWRYSQLLPGKNFLTAGWSEQAYAEHAAVMQWALSRESNGALNLRIPGLVKYTRDTVGELMGRFIEGEITVTELAADVQTGWNEINLEKGKLDQLGIYRASLGMDDFTEVELCRLHRDLMDEKNPSICRQYDALSPTMLLLAILVPSCIVLVALAAYILIERRKKIADSIWLIQAKELNFADSPQILGRGSFGLVLLAEYRGTQVAVKRVIPPRKDEDIDAMGQSSNALPTHESVRYQLKDSQQPRFSSADVKVKKKKTKKTKLMLSAEARFNASGSGKLRAQHDALSKPVPDVENDLWAWTVGTENDKYMQSGTTRRETAANSGTWTLRDFKFGNGYDTLKSEFIDEMRYFSKLKHPCITTVMGAVIAKKEEPMLVMEYMTHGSLYDILHNETVPLDGDLLLPILRDIAQGMRFLHAATPKVIHGDLKAHNVLVDDKFRAKVADFGLSAKKTSGATGTPLWMAPELLTGKSKNTIASDVYSFGIILYEVYSRKDPYEGEDTRQVLESVADPKIQKRPQVPEACPSCMISLMIDSLNEDPELRPTFEEIDLRLKRLDSESAEPGESYRPLRVRNLEVRRSEDMLAAVFPMHIATALREGHKVLEPEGFDLVTILVLKLAEFTTLSTSLSEHDICAMLDRLYLKLDALSRLHDVFKIETIGDSYICVTNLVKDQTEDHAKRIAQFSVDAVQAARETFIKVDDPSMGSISIRVGFHSGPVIARVVGSHLPKYSVFGDTVNTAVSMESHSEPGEIHCSDLTAKILMQQYPEMGLMPRGRINVKGKGGMNTFYLSNKPQKIIEEGPCDQWRLDEGRFT